MQQKNKFDMTFSSWWHKILQTKISSGEFQVATLEESTNQETSSYKYKECYSIGLSQNTNL